MANRTIYTRVYSESSAGKLFCGRNKIGDPLTNDQLLEEFENHADIHNREPTALVSVSDRIIDTLKRAFDKFHMGEGAHDIWIAFIEVPDPIPVNPATRIHPARDLAEENGHFQPELFRHEFIFEWFIPKEYILHQVSLRTLIDRGLGWTNFTGFEEFIPITTSDLRSRIAEDWENSTTWEIGMTLGFFAKAFGARAPLGWIYKQFFDDCKTYNLHKFGLCYWNEVKEGIDDFLIDWWLTGSDFLQDDKEFKRMEGEMYEEMAWDFMDYIENLGSSYYGEEDYWHEMAEDEFAEKHKRLRQELEEEAVRIGL